MRNYFNNFERHGSGSPLLDSFPSVTLFLFILLTASSVLAADEDIINAEYRNHNAQLAELAVKKTRLKQAAEARSHNDLSDTEVQKLIMIEIEEHHQQEYNQYYALANKKYTTEWCRKEFKRGQSKEQVSDALKTEVVKRELHERCVKKVLKVLCNVHSLIEKVQYPERYKMLMNNKAKLRKKKGR